jgi:spermidine synthase
MVKIWKRLTKNKAFQLFIVSTLALFLEIAIIRWLSSGIRIFAFLKNIPLIISFLGLGLGIMTKRSKIDIKGKFIEILTLLVFLLGTSRVSPLSKVPIPSGEDLWIWRSSESFLDPYLRSSLMVIFYSWVVYAVVVSLMLVLVFLLFFAIGQLLQERLKKFKPLDAYKYNLLGSIFGILLFTLLSFLNTSPFWWVLIGYLVILLFIKLSVKNIVYFIIGVTVVYFGTLGVYWSPYYRIDIKESIGHKDGQVGSVALTVNHVYFQQMANLSDGYLSKYPSEELNKISVNYNLPYLFVKNPGDVLVVGAGGGNDVAAALRHGAKSVDAVDIDPVIMNLGGRYHPEKPYANIKVNRIVDDARSYFEKTDRKYDTIVFGLLDSHTTTSTFSNVRLDNFVYTTESFSSAKDLLKENGSIILSFAAGKPWILQRISIMLENAFGEKPHVFRRHKGADGGIFILGRNLDKTSLKDKKVQDLSIEINGNENVYIPTDDWPYLYLKSPGVPNLYLATLLLVTIVFLYLTYLILEKQQYIETLHLKKERGLFFFLGAAFLLIEVKSINQLSVLFGSTWIVNSAVIFGILSMAFFANSLIKRNIFPKINLIIVGLITSILLGYFIDFSGFSGESFLNKFVLASFILALPLFFSGLLFSHLFKKTKDIAGTFGANLYGAFFGGMIENAGMMIGIRNLSFLAIGFYILAIMLIPKAFKQSRK